MPFVTLLTFIFIACELTVALGLEARLRVVPVLFIPSDNSEIRDGGRVAEYRDRIRKYLALAQSYYRTQLVTDSFEIAGGDPLVYEAGHPHSYYDDHFSKLEPDVAHGVVRVFAWLPGLATRHRQGIRNRPCDRLLRRLDGNRCT
jgi:hypothetical protein